MGRPDEIADDTKGRKEGLPLGCFQERVEMWWPAPSKSREDELAGGASTLPGALLGQNFCPGAAL